ncbi:unnamed protein product, partial [Strongylus vulgaris]
MQLQLGAEVNKYVLYHRLPDGELVQTTSEICDPEELLSICLEFVPAPTNVIKSEEDATARPSTSASTSEPPAKKAKK